MREAIGQTDHGVGLFLFLFPSVCFLLLVGFVLTLSHGQLSSLVCVYSVCLFGWECGRD